MATQVQVFAGTYTIGGNVISVTSGSDRIVFDFGSPFIPGENPYDAAVLRRNRSWVRDAIRLKLTPAIDGIFSRKDLGNWQHIQAAEESDLNTAVLITHLHLDHMACMGMVAPSIPVYMHPTVRKLEHTLDAIGESVRRDGRTYSTIEPGVPLKVGCIEVHPILTDGLELGTLGFYITTPDGTLYWPGDVVLHGIHSDIAWESFQFVKERGVDVLFCDATSFMDEVMTSIYGEPNANVVGTPELPPGMMSLGQVMDEVAQVAAEHTGLTIFSTYTRDPEYAMLLLECAQKSGKIVAFEPEKAYVLSQMYGIRPAVYLPDFARYTDASKRPAWLSELLAHCPVVTLEDIKQQPARFIVQNSYRHMMELYDLQGMDGIYLHLDGEPLGDFDPAYPNLRKMLDWTGFKYVSFGKDKYFSHAYPNQVQYYVDQINPKVLVPCHSFNPERLKPGPGGVQLLPVEGNVYLLEKGKLHDANNQ